MRGVFGPGKAGFHQGETQLHEHDQIAGDQGPDEIDGDLVMADGIGNFFQDGLARFLGGNVFNVPVSCPPKDPT